MPAETVAHRLIIRHPSAGSVLVVESAGVATLPVLLLPDRHTADVDYLNAAVLARWGLRTFVLRSLLHFDSPAGTTRVHELEAFGDAQPKGAGWRPALALGTLADPGDRTALAAWRSAPDTAPTAVDGRDWNRPGWYEEVRHWIGRALHYDAALGDLVETTQQRAWQSSCVIRVRATRGDCYFKAVSLCQRSEPAVTGFLARRFSHLLPRVIAAEPERRWWLMAAVPGTPIDELDVPRIWAEAAAAYGGMQAACVPLVEQLKAVGCPARPLEHLADAVGALCAGPLDGLTPEEADRFRALAPSLEARCSELASHRVPLTLEHGDLWPGNILADGHACAILDWEDAGIAHPFLSLAPLHVGLAGCRSATPAALAAVERAYLGAFSRFDAGDVQHAARLAKPLAFVDMAVRYRQQRASVTALHPWMKDLVPETLRLAMSCASEALD